MTDRVKGCWVAFDKDIRIDDVEEIINAIKMIKYVADVKLSAADHADWMNRAQLRLELRSKLGEAINEILS